MNNSGAPLSTNEAWLAYTDPELHSGSVRAARNAVEREWATQSSMPRGESELRAEEAAYVLQISAAGATKKATTQVLQRESPTVGDTDAATQHAFNAVSDDLPLNPIDPLSENLEKWLDHAYPREFQRRVNSPSDLQN